MTAKPFPCLPGSASARVLDVVVIPDGRWREDPARRLRRRVEGRIDLGAHVFATRFPGALGVEVIKACSAPGYREHETTYQFGELLSFVSEPQPVPMLPQRLDGADRDLLTRVVALSRLVRATPIGLEYAARVLVMSTGSVREIIPLFGPGRWSTAP